MTFLTWDDVPELHFTEPCRAWWGPNWLPMMRWESAKAPTTKSEDLAWRLHLPNSPHQPVPPVRGGWGKGTIYGLGGGEKNMAKKGRA